ncbi:hypothetical protein [Streptomyces sp. NPDC091212]|uniref:hypothetical protein n=1 Tax=Streptomyces sp. NPDC091212 TaxID=3155191 RepID=UPI0034130EA8
MLLAAAPPGTVYGPDTDDDVRAELAAAREAGLRQATLVAARADELQALRKLGTLEQTEPREGDEAVGDELTRRTGWCALRPVVDGFGGGATHTEIRALPAGALASLGGGVGSVGQPLDLVPLSCNEIQRLFIRSSSGLFTTQPTGSAGPTGDAVISSDPAPAITSDKPHPRYEDHDLQLQY